MCARKIHDGLCCCISEVLLLCALLPKLGWGVDNCGNVMKISSTTSLICLFWIYSLQ